MKTDKGSVIPSKKLLIVKLNSSAQISQVFSKCFNLQSVSTFNMCTELNYIYSI